MLLVDEPLQLRHQWASESLPHRTRAQLQRGGRLSPLQACKTAALRRLPMGSHTAAVVQVCSQQTRHGPATASASDAAGRRQPAAADPMKADDPR